MTQLDDLVADLKRLSADSLLLLAEGKPSFVLAVSGEGNVGRVEPQVIAPEGTPNLLKSAAMGRGLAALFAAHGIRGYVLLTHCWLVECTAEAYQHVTEPEEVPLDDRIEYMLLVHRMQGAQNTFEACRVNRAKDTVTHSPWAPPESPGVLQAMSQLAVPDW